MRSRFLKALLSDLSGRVRAGFLLPVLAAVAGGHAAPAPLPGDFSREAAERVIRAHVAFLADDLLEGRGTGTRGHEVAAHYVAAQFARLGLKPAGDNGTYAQTVAFREMRDANEAGRFAVHGVSPAPEFAAVTDALVRAAAGQEASDVRAPAVFVGFGVRAPELGHDDLGDVDLRGKIVVAFWGAPKRFSATQRAYYSDGTFKAREYVRRGAVGVVTLTLPADEARYPWAFILAQSRFPRMRLVDAAGRIVDGFPELKASASLNAAASARLLGVGGRNAAAVIAAAERGEAQRFPLGCELELSGRASVLPAQSRNVLALLPGSDPALAAEPIVVTGHLDHIGIGPAVDGDTIYNGAMDNAMGIGLLLAVAEHLATRPAAPRPVLFAAVTGEEKGLLGAEHLALHPPAGVRRYAANFNVDMPIFPAPVRDLVARGDEHSTLGAVLAQAAAARGFTVSPDPIPDEVIFVRSDQYAFVKTGVPALYLSAGDRSDDPAVDLKAATTAFLRTRYHKPNDDLTQPIDWPSAAAFADVSAGFVRAVSEDRTAPAWYAGDFFGNKFGGDAPRAPKPSAAKTK